MISIDDEQEIRVKVIDTPNNTEIYVLKNHEWEEVTDGQLPEWINNELPAEEFKLWAKMREELRPEKDISNEKVIDNNIGIADTIDPSTDC